MWARPSATRCAVRRNLGRRRVPQAASAHRLVGTVADGRRGESHFLWHCMRRRLAGHLPTSTPRRPARRSRLRADEALSSVRVRAASAQRITPTTTAEARTAASRAAAPAGQSELFASAGTLGTAIGNETSELGNGTVRFTSTAVGAERSRVGDLRRVRMRHLPHGFTESAAVKAWVDGGCQVPR